MPGAAIERIIEIIKWKSRRLGRLGLRWVDSDAEITAFNSEIEKLKSSMKEEDSAMKEIVIDDRFNRNAKLSASGKKLVELQKELTKRETEVKLYTYLFSLAIAFFISRVLVGFFRLGLLQVLGYANDPPALAVDILMSAVIMAFLTKPTHDLVSIIEKIRNPQDAAA